MKKRHHSPWRDRGEEGIPLQVEHIEHRLAEYMKAAKLDPAFIYAFERTRLMVTEANIKLISPEDLAEWEAAVREYRRKESGA